MKCIPLTLFYFIKKNLDFCIFYTERMNTFSALKIKSYFKVLNSAVFFLPKSHNITWIGSRTNAAE